MTRFFLSNMRIANQAPKLPIAIKRTIFNHLPKLSTKKEEIIKNIELLKKAKTNKEIQIEKLKKDIIDNLHELGLTEYELENTQEKNYHNVIAQVMEDPWIFSFDIGKEFIRFTTNATHLKLRNRDDGTTDEMNMIGCFDVKIYITGYEKNAVKITNLIYGRNPYPHWAVHTSKKMCRGEFEDRIKTHIKNEEYIELINDIKEFLHSWKDTSTYRKHHNWMNTNKDIYGRELIEKINQLPRFENYANVAQMVGKNVKYNPNSKSTTFVKKTIEKTQKTKPPTLPTPTIA